MKDALLILGICLIIIAAAAAVYFNNRPASYQATSQAAAADAATSITIIPLSTGTNASSLSSRVNYLVTSQDELAFLWSEIYASSTPPTIDFTKNDALAVFDGVHSTGGYGISISSVTDSLSSRTITIVHTAPGTSCVTTQATTSPFQIVSVPKTTLPLSHIDETATSSCP